MKTQSLTAVTTSYCRILFFARDTARGASNPPCRPRKRSFLSFCFSTGSLLAFLLVISPAPLEAEIILTSRLSQVNAAAAAGSLVAQVDEPPAQKVTDFSPATLNLSATASKDGGSGNGNSASNAQITFDSSTDTLVVTASGSASGAAQRSTALPTSHSNNHGGGGGPSILLTFTLTDRSYDFTATGACSAAFSGLGGGSSSGAQLGNAQNPNVPFLVRAEAFSEKSADDKSISQSGTLAPGTWSLLVFHQASVIANDTTPSASASASVELHFTLRPAGTPPPPPAPNHWTNTAGGSFQNAANWSLQTIPAGNSTAIFDPAAAYAVNVGTVTSNRLVIQNGDVTFTNAAYTVSSIEFDPASVVLDNAKLTLASGQLNSGHALIGLSGAARIDVQAGAVWNNTGSLRVGGAGNGILAIADGGKVTSAEARIGSSVAGGKVFLSGGAQWTSGNLAVGFSGAGMLTATDGLIRSINGSIGLNDGASGTVILEDEAIWALDGGLVVGVSGTGTVALMSGASLQLETLTVGGPLGATGSVTVSGVSAGQNGFGASLYVFGETTVNGTLLIEKGGFSQHLDLADQTRQPVIIGATSDGSLTIRGTDPASGKQSHMRDISVFTVGEAKRGTLLVDDAFVQNVRSASLGAQSGAVGDVTVENGGTWNVDTNLVVGKFGRGNVTVKDNSAVTADVFTIGEKINSIGTAVVTGADSFLDIHTSLLVGEDGRGKLTVAAGAKVFIGALSQGNLVMGGQETFTSELTVGGRDPNDSAASGARISVNGNLVMGSSAVSVDKLNITEDGTLSCVDATLGAVEHSFTEVYLGTVGGNGVVAQFNISGDLTVGEAGSGLIILRNAGVTVGGTLFVGDHGAIAGTGTVSAATRIVSAGRYISPGLSSGTLIFESDFEQTATGTLRMEAAGVEPGQFDVLRVTGNAALGGSMEVTFLNGFLPKAGDTFPFLQVDGAVSGDFAQITFPQLAAGFQIKTEMVNGTYQLTALNNAVRRFGNEMFRALLAGDPASHAAAGFFKIHTTARGGVSGQFVLGGRRFATSGKFDSAGKLSRVIPRNRGTPLTLNLELVVIDGARVITGTIVDGEQTIDLSADAANTFNPKTSPAPQAGKYTTLLQFDPAASDAPQANGFGIVTISKSGAVRFAGALADGTRLSQGTVLSRSGESPIYVSLYKKQGSLFGELQFREQPGSDFDGTLWLSRPPTPADNIQTAGFSTTLSAIGSRYAAPPVRPTTLDLPNGATAALRDAELTPALTKSLMLSPPNKFAVLDPGADKFSLSVNASNGRLSGRFVHPATGLSTEVQGVVFQKQNFGSGFFLRPGTIGSFELQARP